MPYQRYVAVKIETVAYAERDHRYRHHWAYVPTSNAPARCLPTLPPSRAWIKWGAYVSGERRYRSLVECSRSPGGVGLL